MFIFDYFCTLIIILTYLLYIDNIMHLINLNFESVELITIYTILGVCLLTQFVFYLGYYYRLARKTKFKEISNNNYPPISIIICTENQLSALQRNLPIILDLDYPNYEVIVVDMNSEDESATYLEYMTTQHKNLYCSFTTKDARIISHRKLAQTIGIKASKHEWLVFTEPDCQPISNKWLKEIAAKMEEKTAIVLGYSRYEKIKGRLNQFIAYDNILTSMRYLGFALANQPYTGIGKNLAYKKELFFTKKAYINQLNLQRGEDELFINTNANRTNTSVVSTPESVIEMDTLESRKAWRIRKLMHLTSAARYTGTKHYWHGFDSFTRIVLYTLGTLICVLALLSHQWSIAGVICGGLLIQWLLQVVVTNTVSKRLGDGHRYYLSILKYNFTIPLYTFILKFRLPKRKRGDILKY